MPRTGGAASERLRSPRPHWSALLKVIALGAGLLGVTSAHFLRQQGFEVTVVDRRALPAAETSFADGGQASVSHAEPQANPSAPLKVLQWQGKEDAPLLFRIRTDMRQWLWGQLRPSDLLCALRLLLQLLIGLHMALFGRCIGTGAIVLPQFVPVAGSLLVGTGAVPRRG